MLSHNPKEDKARAYSVEEHGQTPLKPRTAVTRMYDSSVATYTTMTRAFFTLCTWAMGLFGSLVAISIFAKELGG